MGCLSPVIANLLPSTLSALSVVAIPPPCYVLRLSVTNTICCLVVLLPPPHLPFMGSMSGLSAPSPSGLHCWVTGSSVAHSAVRCLSVCLGSSVQGLHHTVCLQFVHCLAVCPLNCCFACLSVTISCLSPAGLSAWVAPSGFVCFAWVCCLSAWVRCSRSAACCPSSAPLSGCLSPSGSNFSPTNPSGFRSSVSLQLLGSTAWVGLFNGLSLGSLGLVACLPCRLQLPVCWVLTLPPLKVWPAWAVCLGSVMVMGCLACCLSVCLLRSVCLPAVCHWVASAGFTLGCLGWVCCLLPPLGSAAGLACLSPGLGCPSGLRLSAWACSPVCWATCLLSGRGWVATIGSVRLGCLPVCPIWASPSAQLGCLLSTVRLGLFNVCLSGFGCLPGFNLLSAQLSVCLRSVCLPGLPGFSLRLSAQLLHLQLPVSVGSVWAGPGLGCLSSTCLGWAVCCLLTCLLPLLRPAAVWAVWAGSAAWASTSVCLPPCSTCCCLAWFATWVALSACPPSVCLLGLPAHWVPPSGRLPAVRLPICLRCSVCLAHLGSRSSGPACHWVPLWAPPLSAAWVGFNQCLCLLTTNWPIACCCQFCPLSGFKVCCCCSIARLGCLPAPTGFRSAWACCCLGLPLLGCLQLASNLASWAVIAWVAVCSPAGLLFRVWPTAVGTAGFRLGCHWVNLQGSSAGFVCPSAGLPVCLGWAVLLRCLGSVWVSAWVRLHLGYPAHSNCPPVCCSSVPSAWVQLFKVACLPVWLKVPLGCWVAVRCLRATGLLPICLHLLRLHLPARLRLACCLPAHLSACLSACSPFVGLLGCCCCCLLSALLFVVCCLPVQLSVVCLLPVVHH